MSRLDILDAAFHYCSGENNSRDHYAMYVFDSPGEAPTIEQITSHVRIRAARVPELNRRIAQVPLDLDYPRWVSDDQPVESRLVRHDLSRCTWADAEALIGELKQVPVDAGTQAWKLHVVEGLRSAPRTAGTPTVVIVQISHALTAGMGAAALGRALFSTDTPQPLPGHGPVDGKGLAADAVRGALTLPYRAARYLWTARRARRAYRDRPDAGSLGHPTLRAAVRTNADPTERRAVHVLPFEPGAFRCPGISVTTLGLTAVRLAHERFLAEFGEKVPSTFNARVPIAVPDDVDWPAANRVVTCTVDLAGGPDLMQRAITVRESLAAAREHAVDPLLLGWAKAENQVPAPVYLADQRRRRARRQPTRTAVDRVAANSIVVSVNHGPSDLELCGAKAVCSGDFPTLAEGRSVTHGFYGLGDSVTVCAVVCPDTFPEHDRYASILEQAVKDVTAACSGRD